MYDNLNNYPSSSYNFNFDIKHYFKNIIDDLKNHISSLFNKREEYYISSIKDNLNNIANLLENTPQLSNEFLIFLRIKKMLFYILDNYDSLKSVDLNRFFNLITPFYKVLLLKINYIKNQDLKNQYQNEYNQFKSKLNTSMKDFHKNIYKRSDMHDEVMVKVSKILME